MGEVSPLLFLRFDKGPPKMSLTSTSANLVTLAEGDKALNHPSLEPLVTGGGALIALLLLLWITVSFNRDR
ncbi:Hypothetical protein SCLAV_1751 [Streptomyces clavuligerus]|uniref:Uncharacterized protein n=2 Tax=Streptomyces clavuligerus TaxID=1901 RepID=E2Q3K5_STRCL|nr:Hypothetical protein SCLAV_1751 [Streptomyces clavuligerus]